MNKNHTSTKCFMFNFQTLHRFAICPIVKTMTYTWYANVSMHGHVYDICPMLKHMPQACYMLKPMAQTCYVLYPMTQACYVFKPITYQQTCYVLYPMIQVCYVFKPVTCMLCFQANYIHVGMLYVQASNISDNVVIIYFLWTLVSVRQK